MQYASTIDKASNLRTSYIQALGIQPLCTLCSVAQSAQSYLILFQLLYTGLARGIVFSSFYKYTVIFHRYGLLLFMHSSLSRYRRSIYLLVEELVSVGPLFKELVQPIILTKSDCIYVRANLPGHL